jgi:hypothetical protein
LIDYAKEAIRLTPSSGEDLEYVAGNFVIAKIASDKIVLNHLDAASTLDIRTVSEYPYVFLDGLPGMSPNCEFEVVFELVPGSAPMFKRPYRMTASQLAEFNEQLQELLDRDISALVHHLGKHLLFLYQRKMVRIECEWIIIL